MKHQKQAVAGIDISKNTFDISLRFRGSNEGPHFSSFSNTLKGYDRLTSWLQNLGLSHSEVLFCLENTGIYHRLLSTYLLGEGAFVWVETPVQIKWSQGLQRGKSDKMDARRIMQYAERHHDQAKAYEEQDRNLQKVADFLSLRSRLMQCIHTLEVPINELKAADLVQQSNALEQASRQSIAVLKKEFKALEKKIKDQIALDPKLKRLYDLITSVRCVGFVTATHLMVYTNAFKRFDSAKQLASFAGIAPFEYSSGISIRGKTKVHPMANKTLKTILHLCAIRSIKDNPELQAYFKRKVAEGKNKMLVINAIRNKVLQRIFVCVKNNREYIPVYTG